MNPDMTYAKARANAAALKALGQTKVYLFHGDDFPWHLAAHCEPGGMHRLDLCVSVRFYGSEDGIEYSWSFDIESRDASGGSQYRFDMDAIKAVLGKVKGRALVQFREYLSDAATKVKSKGDEFQVVADKQFRDAAVLRDLVNYAK